MEINMINKKYDFISVEIVNYSNLVYTNETLF